MSFFAIAGFILDLAVLAALIATIYYAMRLSKNLSVIRADKKELRELIAALSKNIDHANAAAMNLRATGTKTADTLQGLLVKGKALSEELQLMNEAGNNLAERLERSVKNTGTKTPARAEAVEVPRTPPSFFIHDRDFEDNAGGNDDWAEQELDGIPDHLQTQAERELYTALRKNQKKSPASGRH